METKQLELTALDDRLEKAKAAEAAGSEPAAGSGPEHLAHLEEQVRKLEAQVMANKQKEKK